MFSISVCSSGKDVAKTGQKPNKFDMKAINGALFRPIWQRDTRKTERGAHQNVVSPLSHGVQPLSSARPLHRWMGFVREIDWNCGYFCAGKTYSWLLKYSQMPAMIRCSRINGFRCVWAKNAGEKKLYTLFQIQVLSLSQLPVANAKWHSPTAFNQTRANICAQRIYNGSRWYHPALVRSDSLQQFT